MDGCINLLKDALDTDPNLALSRPVLQPHQVNGKLTLPFSAPGSVLDAIVVPMLSSGLMQWHTGPSQVAKLHVHSATAAVARAVRDGLV